MDVSVIGSGYVGTTLAACLADLGHDVVAVDIDEDIVERLNEGEAPIHEPGLQPLLDAYTGSRLRATTDYDAVPETDLTFVTVQTPSREDGSIDISAVEAACRDVGESIAEKDEYHLVVVKSTVIPGMTEEVLAPAIEAASGKTEGEGFGLAVNPEFQAQGSAVQDFMEPDKLVLGTDGDDRALDLLANCYEPLVVDWDPPVVETGRREAAMIKYANNVFLASKISLINELGNVCKEYGVDSYEVADAMGLDDRIGAAFLRSGAGWGGSCLTGDQQIIVDDGETRHLTLAEFFERYVDGDTVTDVSVLSCDAEGEFSFKPVQAATKRAYDGQLHTVRTSMNKSVTTTHDHPMVLVNEDVPEVVQANQLEVGDRIPVLNDIPERPVESFDLIDVVDTSSEFENNEVYLKPSFDVGAIESELRVELAEYNAQFDYDKIRDFVRGDHLPLDVFLSVEEPLGLSRRDVRIYTSTGRTTYVPAVIDADEAFWRFIGYYLAEGHINEDDSGHGSRPRKRIMLSFHPEEEREYVADVERYLDRQEIKHHTRQQETTRQVEFSSRVFAAFLLEIGCGTGSYDAEVPESAYRESESNRMALLSGLFRGDGHVEYTSHSNAVVYDYGSVSEQLTDGMTILLHGLDIVPSYKISQSKKSTVPAHFLRVSAKQQISRLKGLFLDEEQERIQARLDAYERDIQPSSHKRRNGFTSVRVREVETEPAATAVYSLEVADDHTFVTTDGLVVHNCFPKDTAALMAAARERDYEPELLEQVVAVNDRQPLRMIELLERHVDPSGERIAVLGAAFKPGTDDTRGTRSRPAIEGLLERGATPVLYDPTDAAESLTSEFDGVEVTDSAADALEAASGALVMTDWPEFSELDAEFDAMANPVVVDGRRIIGRRRGLTYEGLTW